MKLVVSIPELLKSMANSVLEDIKNSELDQRITKDAKDIIKAYIAALVNNVIEEDDLEKALQKAALEIHPVIAKNIYQVFANQTSVLQDIMDNCFIPDELCKHTSVFNAKLQLVLNEEKENLDYYVDAISYAYEELINKHAVIHLNDLDLSEISTVIENTTDSKISIVGDGVFLESNCMAVTV